MKPLLFNDSPRGAARAAGSDLEALKTDLHISGKAGPSVPHAPPRSPRAGLAAPRTAGDGLPNTGTALTETQLGKFQALLPFLRGGTQPGEGACVSSLPKSARSPAEPRGGVGTALWTGSPSLCTVSGVTSFEIPQEAGKERFELDPAD